MGIPAKDEYDCPTPDMINEYHWSEADILLEIMKKDKEMKNARKEEDDYDEPTFK